MIKIILVSIVSFSLFACSNNIPDLINNENISENIIFTWDINPFDDNLGSVTETIGNLTVTVTAPLSEHSHSVGYFDILDFDNISDGNVVVSFHKESAITFEFSKPVMVESIIALSGDNKDVIYTFTPLETNNSVVTQALSSGIDIASARINLNWDNITSFTVTSSTATLFGFDFLTVIDSSEQ